MKEETIKNKLPEYKSFFWSPDYVEESAWIEHVPFAFWIIEVLKPKSLAELGIHNGTSYFAFCQAIKTMNINAVCYGVDTWKGDEHAGFYNEEVFQRVTDHNTAEFSRFSTLIRSTFDEARQYFIDGSIDLLHIDGLHTYESVKHDFEAWLPKLSDNGVIIFHDTNVRERNFGVFKLWEELKQNYPSFQFDFGHGLGILAVGKIVPGELKDLFDQNKNDAFYTFLVNIFSERGTFFKTNFKNGLTIKALEAANAELNESHKQLSERHKVLEEHITLLTDTQKTLVLTNNQIQANLNSTETANSQLQINLKDLAENQGRLVEQNKILESAHSQLNEKSKIEIADLSKKLKNIESSLNNTSNELTTIKKENESFRKNITWYKNTYENRSILGVLKEKFKTLLKKKINHDVNGASYSSGDSNDYRATQKLTRKNYYYLNPSKDLKLSDKGLYTTTGGDPFFLVDLKNKPLKRGWFWLRIEVMKEKGMLLSPKLYYDYGNGFNEEDVWNLPRINNGKIESLVEFPADLQRLRFDPTTTECTFSVKGFNLKSVSKIKAFGIAVLKQKKGRLSSSNYFSGYIELVSTLFKSGIPGAKKRLWDSIRVKEERIDEKYIDWCDMYDTISERQLDTIKSLSNSLPFQPLFSIIMPVYNAPVYYLKKAIESVELQAYKNWELCIADDKSTNRDVRKLLKKYQAKDKRIKIIFREINGHISNASNSALELAKGEYMVLLDQDDELTPHCLYMVAKAINENRNLQLIYSDEDKIDEQGNRFDPYFKTNWNKDLIYGQNMINHLGVYKLSLINTIGGFRVGYEGSQDHDLILRCIEHLESEQIYHIPHVLYHWRAREGSTSVAVSNKSYAIDAGIKALNDHLKRTDQKAIAEQNVYNSYRIIWSLPEYPPMVSIIIPTKDNVDVLSTCVTSILQKTSYKNFEILIIDNNSGDPSTLEYLKSIQENHEQVKVYKYKSEFNFSAIVNYGVQQSKAEIILLLNNDTEVINEDWLYEMVSQSMREEIGAVGAKLYYPNGQIQHAGVFLYEGHPGNHIYLRRDKYDPGYFNKLNLVQNYTAVTAACLAVRRELYLKAGGFDESNLKVAYNDVDFCLKVRELGYRNLWTPFAQLVHYESLSRGNDLDEINFARFKREWNYMLERWKDAISNEPFFNPNLGHDTRNNQFAFPPRVKYEWQDI